jgi:pentose-5-phosphate-3-epimerase
VTVPRLSAGVITADLARLGGDLVGVDGGVTVGNAAEVAGWGPDVVVSGSAIFGGRDPARSLGLLAGALEGPGRVS